MEVLLWKMKTISNLRMQLLFVLRRITAFCLDIVRNTPVMLKSNAG